MTVSTLLFACLFAACVVINANLARWHRDHDRSTMAAMHTIGAIACVVLVVTRVAQ